MNPPPRVLFRERQRLRAADLRAEQDYLLGLSGRHYIGPHTWGIVRGLALSVADGVVTVQPGLAVDGYGRELALFQPVQVSFQQDGTKQYVYLYYCERPQGSCGDAPNPRWSDSAEVMVSADRWSLPDEELSRARAAGTFPDAPPWPVLLGIIDRDEDGNPKVNLSESPFSRLRAARIASPSHRTVMRVGQENLADPYHFCVSAQDTMGVLQNGFAIDRDGNPIYWRNLIVTGSNLAAVIATQIQGLSIKAVTKKPAGKDILWRALPGTTQGRPTLELSFRDKADPDPRNIEKRKFALNQGLVAALASFSRKSKLVTLSKIGKGNQPRAKRETRAQEVTLPDDSTASVVLDDRESSMDYEDGALSFTPEDLAAPPAPCGCTPPVENPEKLPEGFVFRPGPAAPVPPTRDVYCIRVSPASQAPVEELRISGGVFADGDFTRRITICNFEKQFQPWLTVLGNGTVELIGKGQRDANQRLYPMIQATGTIELPPVQPDPRDPLFNYLLVLSFIYGVLSPSSSLLKITFPNPPPFVETRQDWSYNLSIQNLSVESAVAQNNAEIIMAGNHWLPRTIPNLPQQINANAIAPTITVRHTPGDIPLGALKLAIQVSVAMRAGSTIVGGKSTSPEIPVVESPVIDLSTLTNPIAHGSANFQPSIQNQSDRSLTVTDIKVEGLGVAQHLSPVPSLIAPGDTLTADPATIPAAGNNVTITVTISYTWDGTNMSASLSALKTVDIT